MVYNKNEGIDMMEVKEKLIKIFYIIILLISLVLSRFLSINIIKNNIKIDLIGDKTVQATYQDKYKDRGFTIEYFGKKRNIKHSRYKVDTNIDTTVLGKYQYIYNITYKGFKYKLKRVIEVVDNIKPDLHISSDAIEKDYCTKENKFNIEANAFDNYDGDITDKIIKTEVDDKLIYEVSDSSGNKATKEVNIKYSEIPESKIKLNGDKIIYVVRGSSYNDKGAVIVDGCGNTTNDNVIRIGRVDTSKTGTYEISYFSNDYSLSIKRTVIVYNPSDISSSSAGNGKVIYLTFDDGPGAYTKSILNTLDKYGVKATFFVTHQFSGYLPLLSEEANRGHSIGVHSYTHKWNVYSSVDSYLNDFNMMNDTIEAYTGRRVKIFRFPGGSSNTVSKNYANGIVSAIASDMTSRGYVYFDWDVDSNDAAGGSQTAIYNNVIRGASRCSYCIVLMHDIKKNTANELDNILNTLVSNGYKFGVLSTGSPVYHHKINN